MLYAICWMLVCLYAYMLYAICCMLYAVCCMLYAICYMLYAIGKLSAISGAAAAKRDEIAQLTATRASLTKCAPPCHAMPRHAALRHAMPCHAMPRHATPCHAMPRYATLCYAMPCYVMPPHNNLTLPPPCQDHLDAAGGARRSDAGAASIAIILHYTPTPHTR